MAISDEEVKKWPAKIMIGTEKAFKNNYFYEYEKKKIGQETVYVCSKGSEWSRVNELLVLRCERSQDGTIIWTAYDSSEAQGGRTVLCRQAVFRCVGANITEASFYTWQTNYNADKLNPGVSTNWQGNLLAETRVVS